MSSATAVSVAFMVIFSSLAFSSFAAEDTYSPREKLILMKERISRDLEKAQELRSQAMLQKGRLEGIIQKAKEGSLDPNTDPVVYEKVLAAAPAGLQHAEETFAKTETTIRDLNLKLGWTKRALDNLPAEEGKTHDQEIGAVGFGYSLASSNPNTIQLLRHGHEETIPLEKNQFLPGDEIITDPDSQTELVTLGAGSVIVTVGPGARVRLEHDGKEGATWLLRKGRVHCVPLTAGILGKNPSFVTPEAVVQGDEGSEYDVRIGEKGEAFVEVYQGRVEIKEPKKGTSYFVEAGADASTLPRWWGKNENQ